MEKLELLNIIKQYLYENKKPTNQDVVTVSGASISDEDLISVIDSALEGWFTEGTKAHEFALALKRFFGVRFVQLCNSGSSANLLALLAVSEHIDKSRPKFVITCATGFPTTVTPIYQAGLFPYFVDINPKTLNVNYQDVLHLLDLSNVVGVMLAHTLGFPIGGVDIIAKRCQELGKFFVEDCCFPGNTLVKTSNGDKEIKDVVVGDFVLTRKGYKKVLRSWMTGIKPVINKFGITATKDHPIITKDGVKQLDTLGTSDIIYVWNEKLFCITERNITDIQSPKIDIKESIGGEEAGRTLLRFIDNSGLITLGKFLMALLFIIKMGIHSIMNFQILRPLVVRNMQESILLMNDWHKYQEILNSQESAQRNGMEALRDWPFIALLQRELGKLGNKSIRFAKFVEKSIKLIFLVDQKIVLKSVRVKAETLEKGVPVYNLEVEDCHEFFANNVLVHNCDVLGGKYNHQKVGTFGDIASLSFFPAHHITTGEGGAVFTGNAKLYLAAKSYSAWGKSCICAPGQDNVCGKRFSQQFGSLPYGYDHKYVFTRMGYNLKMTELQAALGLSQMNRVDDFVQDRKDNFAFLQTAFYEMQSDIYSTIQYPVEAEPSPFGFPITVVGGLKSKAIAYLESKGIRTRPVFAGNITRHPMMDNQLYLGTDNPGSDYVMNNTFWVGVHPSLTYVQLCKIVDTCKEFEKGL